MHSEPSIRLTNGDFSKRNRGFPACRDRPKRLPDVLAKETTVVHLPDGARPGGVVVDEPNINSPLSQPLGGVRRDRDAVRVYECDSGEVERDAKCARSSPM